MTGKTHALGGSAFALGSYLMLSKTGAIDVNLDPAAQLLCILPWAIWSSKVPDLDQEKESVAMQTPINLVIQKFFNLIDAGHRSFKSHVYPAVIFTILAILSIFCVEQHLGLIGGRSCSYSQWWGSKTFISFGKLDRESKFLEYKNPIERFQYAEDVLSKRIGSVAAQYLADLVLIDFIIGNEDRHLYNFGVWYDEYKTSFEVAPIFDCGLSLFEHDIFYFGKSLEQVLSKMSQKPFGDRLVLLQYLAGRGLLRKSKFSVSKELIPNDLAKQYLTWSKECLNAL